MTNTEETLILVSADHRQLYCIVIVTIVILSHQFSFGGYALRHNSIFGLGDLDSDDGEKVFTIGYANGPSFNGKRLEIKDENGTVTGCTRQKPSDVEDIYSNPLDNTEADIWPVSEWADIASHGGEDVALQG